MLHLERDSVSHSESIFNILDAAINDSEERVVKNVRVIRRN